MNSSEKKEILNQFLSANSAFDDLLSLSQDLILFKPREDYWSIIEQVVHCLDVDIANFTRYRKAIDSPGSEIFSLGQSWVESLNYRSSSLHDSIQIIKLIRKYMYNHLLSIVENSWEGYYINWPKKGKVKLEDLIQSCISHVSFHRELIDRNINEWNIKKYG